MMIKVLLALFFTCVFPTALRAYGFGEAEGLNKPVPEQARRLAVRGVDLVALDRTDEGLQLLKQALAIAPNYIWAHERYFTARAYNKSQYDEVRADYDDLMSREPHNPIYPLIIAETARVPSENVRPLLESVIKLAPYWAWSHLARSRLYAEGKEKLDDRMKEQMASELKMCIELDETANVYYSLCYVLEKGLGRIDEAISVAEKWIAQPEYRSQGLRRLWELRLIKAKESKDAKASLREELMLLLMSAHDVKTLATARSAFLDLLNDAAAAEQVERTIRRLDPTWYPERGQTLFISATTEGGIPRPLLIANRQISISIQVEEFDNLEPNEEITRLEKLLSLKPGRDAKIYILQRLLRASEKARNRSAFVKYGEALMASEPDDTGLMSKIALALADQKTDLVKAHRYALAAERATRELRPVKRLPNTPPEWFTWSFPDTRWRGNYKRQRALALDALGWVLCQTRDYAAGERALRQSTDIVRGERNLSHLAESLRKLGRSEEAKLVASDANNAWLEALRRQFINRPSTDFQLEEISGRKVKLSNLKGKVVLLDFWATWCVPCVRAMPQLVDLYERYKDFGLEVLAISVDSKSERFKVPQFAKAHKLTFPVLYDEGISDLYQVHGYPTTIFIDRQGNVRYVNRGFEEGVRVFEAVIRDLLQ